MASRIITKKGSGAPLASDLVHGELAVDTVNKRLYTENAGGTVIEVGTNPGEDVTFADNRKAIFGDGSDLQIYHDGTRSYIQDSGNGDLRLRTNELRMVNADNTEVGIKAVEDGAVDLYYNGSEKLSTTNTGIDVTGNVALGDNGKAIFGAGSDLQIYHDGSGSYVSDQGVGPLNLLSGGVRLKDTTDTTTMLAANAGGSVTLYHNNVEKLATTATGIDVEGTITADGLTIDSGGNLSIVIQNAGPGIVFDDTSAVGAGSDKFMIRSVTGQSLGDYEFVMNNDQTSSTDVTVAKFYGNGDVSLFEDTGTTAKFFWDASAESLGIGTTTPVTDISFPIGSSTVVGQTQDSPHLAGNVGSLGLAISDGGGNSGVFVHNTHNGTYSSQDIRLFTAEGGISGATERVRVTPAGNVGINTSSPVKLLELSGNNSGDTSDNPVATLRLSDLDGSTASEQPIGKIEFYGNDPTVPSQNVMAYILSKAASTSGGGDLRFGVCPSGVASEKMRLDYSGNLLIGQTTIPTGLGASNTKLILGSVEDSPEFVAYNSDNAIELGDKIGAYLFGNDDNNATEDHFAGMWAKSASTTGAMDIHFAAGKSNYEDDSPHMTLDSSGNLLVGTTVSTGFGVYKGNENCINAYSGQAAGTGRSLFTGYHSATSSTTGTLAFKVSTNGNVTNINNSYGAISDIKLKENIIDATPKLDKLNQVRVVNFNMIGSEQKQIGVIAQELEQVFPSMVEESPDQDAEGNDLGTTTKSVKYSVFVPMLIKAMQEQQAIIESLTARIEALEGAN